MPRSLVVIGKSVAVMSNVGNCLLQISELVGIPRPREAVLQSFRRARRSRPTVTKNRIERILREHVLDIGDEQFLMLLLMMNSENENRFDFIEQLFVCAGQQIVDMRIDRCAITLCFPHCRTRDQSAQVAPVHVAGGVVVRIKKISVLRDFGAITRTEFFKDKRLEKPRRMREVPFCRTYVGHRLDDIIFRFETCAQTAGEVSDLMKARKQALSAPRPWMKIWSLGRDRVGGGFG